MNIFEKENLLKRAEGIRESFYKGIRKTKKVILKGISLDTAYLAP